MLAMGVRDTQALVSFGNVLLMEQGVCVLVFAVHLKGCLLQVCFKDKALGLEHRNGEQGKPLKLAITS